MEFDIYLILLQSKPKSMANNWIKAKPNAKKTVYFIPQNTSPATSSKTPLAHFAKPNEPNLASLTKNTRQVVKRKPKKHSTKTYKTTENGYFPLPFATLRVALEHF